MSLWCEDYFFISSIIADENLFELCGIWQGDSVVTFVHLRNLTKTSAAVPLTHTNSMLQTH